MANGVITTTAATLMIGAPLLEQSKKVPFVEIAIYTGPHWQFSVGDLGFVLGVILAVAKIFHLVSQTIKKE